jgi:fumarylacetoacetate (FAA) hydrolase
LPVKLVTFTPLTQGTSRPGWLTDHGVWDLQAAWREVGIPGDPPTDLRSLLETGEESLSHLRPAAAALDRATERLPAGLLFPASQVRLNAPIPNPPSFRDFYAFEAHVRNARAKRGLSVPKQWYELPVFYFANHHAICGPEDGIRRPRKTQALDYELEIGCVIGRAGINLSPEEAESHIAGFCILNDWSARDIQRQEMAVGLGPAKGKDFATSLGPCLVTRDELADRQLVRPGRGSVLALSMTAAVNGVEYSRGDAAAMHYTWGELLARASEETWLLPGEIIGSGTVGRGSILEQEDERPYLRDGDHVVLRVERLGELANQILNPY